MICVNFKHFFSIKCFGTFSDVFECESCLYKALNVLYLYIETFLLIITDISSFFLIEGEFTVPLEVSIGI